VTQEIAALQPALAAVQWNNGTVNKATAANSLFAGV
jgi:hypothetical protein